MYITSIGRLYSSASQIMSIPWMIAISSAAASLAIVAVTGLAVLGNAERSQRALPYLISFAVGTLLGSAFLGMLPTAIHGENSRLVLAITLAGILCFFLLEKYLIWRHCHGAECAVHTASCPIILVGDAFHNFVDGVIIAAGFLESAALGLATTLAVIAHEVPQEVGDYGVLLHSGYSRWQAFLYNALSGSTTLAGAAIAYLAVGQAKNTMPYLLAFSAASFLYIGIADLIPTLNRNTHPASGLKQFALVLGGVGVIAALRAASE
jgi:zinc and cadmium transporter